jgi:P4 family phage/plasmid primase-like protien
MIVTLSEELEVSVDSINKLGVGYDLIEECWVFAERDDCGKVIGLSRRYRDGSKFMVPGSKRGLIYECVQTIEKGRVHKNSEFVPARHAGVDCPLCGKRKWCMVTRDNPNDPSAVICGHTPKGAVRHIEGSGYLHRLHTATQGDTVTSPLRNSDKPYIVVEGASDVLAAMDLGYVSVGKPSAESGSLLAAALLQGKNVVILGENDAGAGVRGMDRTFSQLKARCKKAVKCLPPAAFKDLRKWKPTLEEFEAWVEQKGSEADLSRLIYDGLDFRTLAEKFVKSSKARLLYHHDEWWKYGAGKYELLQEKVLSADVAKFFDGYEYVDDNDGKTKPVKINSYFKREVLGAMSDHAISRVPHNVLEPCLINTGKPFDSSHVILFKNGVLDVMNNRLMPHSDNLFTTATLSYDYDPKATYHRWLTAVYEWLEEDEERIALLQEWFGYNMITSNYLEQLMFIYGVPGSGKSTTQRMLQFILDDNYMPMSTQQLCVDQFGLSSLIGKYACMVSEEGNLKHDRGQKLLSVIKQITGNDAMAIRRMYKAAVSGNLFCKITYTSNALPVFYDETQAIFRRYNLLNFKKSFQHNPDIMLYQKLKAERQGVALWAVEGLQRLLKNGGRFTKPALSMETIEELKVESSPLKHILNTMCVLGAPDAYVTRNQLYELYIGVCEEEYVRNPLSNRSFRRKCIDAMPELVDYEVKRTHDRGYNLAIKPEFKKKYLGG